MFCADLVPGNFAIAIAIQTNCDIEIAQCNIPLALYFFIGDLQGQVAVAGLVRLCVRRAATQDDP